MNGMNKRAGALYLSSMIVLTLAGMLFAACGNFLPVTDPEEVSPSSGSALEGGLNGDDSSSSSDGAVMSDASSSSSSSGSSGSSSGSGDTGCTLLTHSNGVGHTYKSCAPLGTYENGVGAACKAHMDGPPLNWGTCSRNPPGCPCPDPNDCLSWTMLGFERPGENYVVWDFAGPAKGHVVMSANGRCPTTADPTWN